MASFYGVNATKQLVNNPPTPAGLGEAGGRVRTIYDKYTFTAVIATTDALYMGVIIPKGARVLDVMVKCADLGTTGAFNIGWSASADGVEAAAATGFFSALDVNTAADIVLASQASAAPSGIFKKFAAPVQVVIVPSTITTATSGDVEIAVTYVID